jgi:CRP-like cAMP-binding protein
LLGLPHSVSSNLVGKAQLTKLPTHSVLNEVNEPIQYLYFINRGLASVLNVLGDGKSVEVGLTGREGFVGVPVIAGFKTSPMRVVMQIEGEAYRISAKDLQAALKASRALETSLLKYSQELALQSAQIAACNRVHEVDERLARWLLMSQDRLGGSLIPLTQEFLAHMLGTRRASVTVAAGILQKAGLISYVRGQLKIEDRERLEDASCECYATLTRQLSVWKSESE